MPSKHNQLNAPATEHDAMHEFYREVGIVELIL